MKILFVMDHLDKLDVSGDSTYVMMLEATSRGWSVWWCTPDQMRVDASVAVVECERVETSASEPFFTRESPRDRELGEFDCIWMRKDPPFNMDYIFTTYMLDLAPAHTVVLNDPRSIKCANEKMYALQWPHLCPKTTVTNRVEDVVSFAKEHGKVVVKPWDGNGGRGVLVTHADDMNLRSIAEIATMEGEAWTIVQSYLPEILKGDKRIILLDGEPVGWFNRVPCADDHRGNMHVGATVHACELTERDLQICAELSPRLKEEGLLFVGIDIIGDYLTEINVTSPTGFREIADLQGRRLESDLFDLVEDKVKGR